MHSVAQTSPIAGQPVPELPSPPPKSPGRNNYWPGSAVGVRSPGTVSPGIQMASAAGSRVGTPGSQVGGPAKPVMELPGSTYLHEHHPFNQNLGLESSEAGGSQPGENVQMGF